MFQNPPILAVLWGLALTTTCFGADRAENSPVAAPAPVLAPLPSAIVLPWTEIGISRETVSLSRTATKNARDALVKAAAPSALPLAKIASSAMPATLKNTAEQIQVSAANIPASAISAGGTSVGGTSVTYAPVWCAMGDSYIFHLVAADTVKNTLLAHAASRVGRSSWEKSGAIKPLVPITDSTMRALFQEVKTQLDARPKAPNAGDALHVGFALGKETTRIDQGSSLCVNLLVSGRLLREYTVVNSIAGEYMAAIRHALQIPAQLRRPTRTILANWEFPAARKAPLQFPLQLRLKSQYSETVFGQPLGNAEESTYTFIADNNGKISVGLDTGLVQFLNGEKRALNLADAPQAAKINGAWVYLDRGRAYGLQMDDRLVGKSPTGKDITGHIVGFFGPEMGLKSPRGYPINEGAIMFVRKGQMETTTGQAYTFDPRKYPSDAAVAATTK